MADAKLSATQQALYDAMKTGVIVHYMPYGGRFNPVAYYFRSDNMKRVTSAADALIAKGLAHRTGGFREKRLELKPKEAP